jgi:hypothetical protein
MQMCHDYVCTPWGDTLVMDSDLNHLLSDQISELRDEINQIFNNFIFMNT